MSVAPEAHGNMAGERACRVCGCTDARACVDLWGIPCHWAEHDLCSHCRDDVPCWRPPEPQPRAAFAGAGATGFTRGAE